MNNVSLEGYINIGQYDGVRQTSTGKQVTTFSLATGNKEYRQYLKCEVWHDEHGTQDGVVDGKYARVEGYPRAWSKDGKSGVNFTIRRIWWAPEREAKPAQQETVYDIDIPF